MNNGEYSFGIVKGILRIAVSFECEKTRHSLSEPRSSYSILGGEVTRSPFYDIQRKEETRCQLDVFW